MSIRAEWEYITDEDKLSLIEDLNEKAVIEDMTDYQSMIRRALLVTLYTEGDELRAEYGMED